MKFEEHKIIEVLNKSWGWATPEIQRVLAVNSMANCFALDVKGCYWRICPEELSATKVADNAEQIQDVFADPEYKKDWQLLGLIDPAEDYFGKLKIGECYAMIKPAVLGGEYSIKNLRIGSIYEYLSFSGELALKTKDLKQGDKVSISFT